jgi:hypothetical protein
MMVTNSVAELEPALNLKFNMVGLSKMSQNVTVSYFSVSLFEQFKKNQKKITPQPFC